MGKKSRFKKYRRVFQDKQGQYRGQAPNDREQAEKGSNGNVYRHRRLLLIHYETRRPRRQFHAGQAQ